MIRATAERNGVPVIILGLSARNVELLKEDKPILTKMAVGDGPAFEVLIMYGQTEQAIIDALRESGVSIPEVAVEHAALRHTRVLE